MKRILFSFCMMALLVPAGHAMGGEAMARGAAEQPKKIIGTLACKVIPHSGLNLLIHSTKGIRCEFTPEDGSGHEYYKGETGIKLGLDVNLGSRKTMNYSVLARHSSARRHQLAGKYSGAGGSASVGATAGNSAPIESNDGSIALQPIGGLEGGLGVAAGFTYIYLEPDTP